MYDINLNKSVGLPEKLDPNHSYVYKSGAYGIYSYWWKDTGGNYWKYTNASEESIDFDPLAGSPLIDPDQPMPHNAPAFFTQAGVKRNVAVPPDAQIEENKGYAPDDPMNIWMERYKGADGVVRYVYRDSDVRENLDLWMQQQLRLADAGLLPFRQYAVKLFNSPSEKDKVFGVILMLVDQGHYSPYDLINASVGDLEFTDITVKLLGRKFLCDVPLIDYLSTLKKDRDPSAPLFEIQTRSGKNPITTRHLYSLFFAMKIPPEQLLYLHANQIFSRIIHRMLSEGVDPSEVMERAMNELSRTLGAAENVEYLIDAKVKRTLMNNYKETSSESPTPGADQAPDAQQEPEQPVAKSFAVAPTDDFGVPFVYSNLSNRRPDELEFSQWLHAEPLHMITDAEEQQMQDQLANAPDSQDTEDSSIVGDEGAVAGGDKEDQENPSDEGAVAGDESQANPSDEGATNKKEGPA